MPFEFRIEEISSGWLDIVLAGGGGRAILSHSYYLGNDAPKLLFAELLKLSSMEEGKSYLLWNDEPGGYLWRLYKKGDRLSYEVGECAGSEEEVEALPFSGEELFSCRMAEIFLKDKVPFEEFAGSILAAFLPYSVGKEREFYEAEWDMPFPEEEFSELLKIFPIRSVSLGNHGE